MPHKLQHTRKQSYAVSDVEISQLYLQSEFRTTP